MRVAYCRRLRHAWSTALRLYLTGRASYQVVRRVHRQQVRRGGRGRG